MRRQRLWIALVATLLIVPAAWALGSAVWKAISPPASTVLLGVRLGLTPSQARSALQTGAQGSFRTETSGEDLALIWTPQAGASSPVRSARLEFHLGQLVALRAELSPSAPESAGPARAVTATSVLARDRRGDAVQITWLARSCPTHADEARRLVEQAPPEAR
ncbi:MAG: hypothetical protein K8H88_08005 [Sandaracinaceae bacterium]|nr:hypothetical protein [Sandaracinaceae bacterium]